MNDFSELQKVLVEQHLSKSEQAQIRDFLTSFSFTKRQQLIDIFLGFPEKISLFVSLIQKKKEFATHPTAQLSKEILSLEEKEIENLIKELGE